MDKDFRASLDRAIGALEKDGEKLRELRLLLHAARQMTVDASQGTQADKSMVGVAFFVYLYLTNLFYNVAGDLALDEESAAILHKFYNESLPAILGRLRDSIKGPVSGDVFVEAAEKYLQLLGDLRSTLTPSKNDVS